VRRLGTTFREPPGRPDLEEHHVAAVRAEAARRRTFAIISHPDAGKTTLTEKFLLYAGAIGRAGAVQTRKTDRATTSDWLELEQQRGISVSSAVARFEHDGHVLNLLDTPGHRDFSEDTYRVLSGVDAAVMVLDAARGVEPQTEKLYAVCKARGTPVITFVNKMDRPSPEPLEILDDIEETLGLVGQPVTWPIKPEGRFEGVIDRRTATAYRFEAAGVRGGEMAQEDEASLAGEDSWVAEEVREEVELLDAIGADVDVDAFLAGTASPVFFGSALSNFGVRLLLDAIVELAPPPSARPTRDGGQRAIDEPFSGLVFKIQANLDPRHRDRMAFVRICSGRFERGETLINNRTGRGTTAKYATAVFGRDRETVDEAYPGDVIGLINAMDLLAGDSLHAPDAPVVFPPLPTFTPEHFATAHPTDRSRTKQFRKGVDQLDEEGVVQVLRHPDYGDQAPIWAAVGQLQFEVATWRMEHEFNAPVRLESTRFEVARATDEDGAKEAGGDAGRRDLPPRVGRADGALPQPVRRRPDRRRPPGPDARHPRPQLGPAGRRAAPRCDRPSAGRSTGRGRTGAVAGAPQLPSPTARTLPASRRPRRHAGSDAMLPDLLPAPLADLLPLDDPGAVFAVLFLLVLLGPLVAERLRLPTIIGLVLGGMLIGPNVSNVLAQNTFIETLGYVGLLYLMFQGGLDLDLDGFRRHRRDSVAFGVATFLAPMVLVTLAATAMGIELLAAIIIASAFASHTLLSYGAVTRFDLAKNRAVTASLGATLIANVLALLVLAVAAAGATGQTGFGFWALFTLGLIVYVAVMLFGVPRFTRWFFTGLGQDRRVRLTYLLSGMGVAAVVAGLIGIEPIVGAFLVGLAFNPFVPARTAIADRVQLLGESVFIPAFLISTGMMLDPLAVADPRTLGLAAALVAAMVLSKLLASEATGRTMGSPPPSAG
jgi:peptide chain release factor 3